MVEGMLSQHSDAAMPGHCDFCVHNNKPSARFCSRCGNRLLSEFFDPSRLEFDAHHETRLARTTYKAFISYSHAADGMVFSPDRRAALASASVNETVQLRADRPLLAGSGGLAILQIATLPVPNGFSI
jgi:hypothetical protein